MRCFTPRSRRSRCSRSRETTREDQILRILFERRYVHYIHRAILEAPEREIAHFAGVGDQTGAAGRNVGEAVAYLPDGGNVVGAP